MRGWRFAAVQCSFQRRTGCLLSRKYPCKVRGGGLFFLLRRWAPVEGSRGRTEKRRCRAATVGRTFEQRRLFGCGRSGAAARRFFTVFCLPSPHSAARCVFSLPLPHVRRRKCAHNGEVRGGEVRGGVLCFTVSRPVRRGSVPLLCPPASPLRAGSGGKPSNVTKKQNIPQRGLQITGFLLYYPKKQIFNSAQRCRQGWNFGEVQLRL